MSDPTIIPPVEGPQEETPQDETSPFIHLSFPKATTIVISVLIVLLAAAIGALGAGTFLLGSAHGATGHVQAQYGASQSQLHATQGQLSSTQSQLSASQAALSARKGAAVVGTWTGTATSGWSGTVTINADHSFTSNGVENGTVYNASGTWSIVTPGTLLEVEPSSNGGWVVSYTISGNTMTQSVSGSTYTLTK